MWQEFYQEHRSDNVEVLSVAMDVQGAEKARPYVERAKATFTTVVDEANLLGQLYGFKAIPNGLLIDEEGVLRYKRFGGFDILNPETAEIVNQWATAPLIEELARKVDEATVGSEHEEAIAHFRVGLTLYREGKVQEAIAEWRKGVELEPENYVIRKQIWAVEHPERFYSDKVDYAWQREQMERGL